ncbi:MAG: TolB family protein, partial [Bryobacteraceae bacterium]
MMRLIFLRILACALIGAPAVLAGSRAMTFLDVLRFRTVAQGTLSPDAGEFVYTVSSLDWQRNRRSTDLYLTGFNGSPTRQLTFTPDRSEVAPAFSPDGRWLAFLSDRNQPAPDPGPPVWQLYLMALDGGEARQIGSVPGGVGTFAFSADGKWIAFTGGAPRERQSYLYDRNKNRAAPLTRHATGVEGMLWAPDASRLYFTAPDSSSPLELKRIAVGFDVRIADPPVSPVHLWQVALGDGQEARLTSGGFTVLQFSVSRDGRWLSFTAAPPDRYA